MKWGVIGLAVVAVAAATGAPHKVVRNTATLDFSYQWSAEAVAIPELDMRFYKDAKAKLAEAQKNAVEDRALAREQKRDFNQHDFSFEWDTAGETPRLLSLQGTYGGFEGGAHPNSYSKALLWDRQSNREISVGSLFARPSDFTRLTHSVYCKRLDIERAKRREGMKLDLAEFNACPKYSDLAIAPVDRNHNGRFDSLDFIASAYVAGPYVEGEYEIFVPVTEKLIAALKPEYRSSFET